MSYVRGVFEELEQIPWSELVAKPRRPGRWAIVAVAIAVGLALLVVRFRTPSTLADVPVAAVPETIPIDPIEEPSVMVSEADLQASSGSGELLALGAAVVEIRATSTPLHYVEWAVAEGLTPLGNDRWSVQVAFQVLTSGPGGPERSAIRRVDVPIQVVEGRAGRAGPLHLSSYEPALVVDEWDVQETPVTPAMTETVLPQFEGWSDVALDSAGTHEGLVRVMVDTGAMMIAVWLDGETALSAVPAP